MKSLRVVIAAVSAALLVATAGAEVVVTIPTNVGDGADAEIRESEANADLTGFVTGGNRGDSTELGTRLSTGRSSISYAKFDISNLPVSSDPFWTGATVAFDTFVRQNGSFSALTGFDLSMNPVDLTFDVLALDPNGTYGANRVDRSGNGYLASFNDYDWTEGDGTPSSGIDFYDAPGIVPHCKQRGSCAAADPDDFLSTVGVFDDFDNNAMLLGEIVPIAQYPGAMALSAGDRLTFEGSSLRQIVLDAIDAGQNTVTVMIHHKGPRDDTVQTALNRNYILTPREHTMLNAGGGMFLDNTSGDYSPTLRITLANQVAVLQDPGLSFWTNPAAWSTNPFFPNNGNGGFEYDVEINNGGTTLISSGTDIVIEMLTLNQGAIAVEGSLTMQDHADWIDGTFVGAGTVNFAGPSTIAGSPPKTLSAVLKNSGTMTWEEGAVNFSSSGMVEAELHNTGTINMSGAGMSFTQAGGSPMLVNETTGVLRRLPVPGTATIEVPTINHGTIDVQSSTLAFTQPLTNTSTGSIIGGGTVLGNVDSNGVVSPGGLGAFAVLEIDGDYTQLAGGKLVIEVGDAAPPPGLLNDQLSVTGTANLAGRLVLPIVPPFTPTPGTDDEVTILTANNVTGQFDSIFSPNLGSLPTEFAVELNYNAGMPGGPPEVHARFVAPIAGGIFVAPGDAEWSAPGTFTILPDSTQIVELQNSAAMSPPQRVTVADSNAFTHRLIVTGNNPVETMTVGVVSGRSLSAVGGVIVNENAAIELDGGNLVSADINVSGGRITESNGGSIVSETVNVSGGGSVVLGGGRLKSSTVNINDGGTIELGNGDLVSTTTDVNGGGRLAGVGTVVGSLNVGTDGGVDPATFDPGSSPGHVEVEGDYQQGANGVLRIDLAGTADGEHDTINVTGNAGLGGSLIVDATGFTGTAGQTFEFFTAGNLEPPGTMLENTFQSIRTVGDDDIYVGLTLGEPVSSEAVGGASVSGTFNATGMTCNIGDMDCDGGPLDGDDVELFARALRTPNSYHIYTWNTFSPKIMIHANDAGDVDGLNDGLDFDDVDDFAMMVSAGSGASVESVLAAIDRAFRGVPEPTTAMLWIIGGSMLCGVRSVRRRRTSSQYSGSHSLNGG